MEPKFIWLIIGTSNDGKSDVLGAYTTAESARFEASGALGKNGMMISLKSVEIDLCL